MNTKIGVIFLVSILVGPMIVGLVAGDISVGVKAGDWIEYQVSTTGNPPEVHNVQWARLEIISVQGPEIKANVTTEDNKGVFSTLTMDLNLQAGTIGAWFIIPADLSVGDTFYDINLGRNVTIEGQEQKTYAGAVRTVINATIPERIKDWDKATGVFVKSIDTLPDYTVNATVVRTNMWNPQEVGLNQTVLYVVVAVVAVLAIGAAVVVVMRRRR